MERNTDIQTELSGFYRFADPISDDPFAEDETYSAPAEYLDADLYSRPQDDKDEPTISHPIDTEHAMAFFGATLGFLGPLTLLLKLFMLDGSSPIAIVAAIFGSVVIVVTAITGYFSGKTIGRLVRKTEEVPLPLMIFVALMIGLYWGIFTGVVGGILILVYGAIWGGLVGGLAGTLAVPPFILLHRYLKTGDHIERGKLIPMTFGIIGSLCAFVLGV
jgi:hypothetical protein